MDAPEARRATAAAISIATALGLPVDDAVVLHSSNKLTLRLLPADVVARVSPHGFAAAQQELDLAMRLVDAHSPVAIPDPRVPPRVTERDGLSVTLWTYYEPVGSRMSPDAYARSLERLHAGMRGLDIPVPHFTDRVVEARQLVARPDQTPALGDDDRMLLEAALRDTTDAIQARGAVEQLLHAEPHPGNVLDSSSGPRFIDLETACRGPIEFDLAHVPVAVSDRYTGVDPALLRDCRTVVLAMVATWRWDRDDELPNGLELGREWTNRLRASRCGAPWTPWL